MKKIEDLAGAVNAIVGAAFEIGRLSGKKEASSELLEKAGRLFMAGEDDLAHKARIWAELLVRDARKDREVYDNHLRPTREAAVNWLEELEERELE